LGITGYWEKNFSLLFDEGEWMDTKKNLIEKVVDLEWYMFQNVENIDGKASCQEDPETFKIMRSSQFESWSKAALESYLDDLNEANKKEINLISEKYGRMMRSTSPSHYAKIEHLLQPLDSDQQELIEKVVRIVLAWEEELMKKYPYILRKGRPLYSSMDSPFVTSVETYSRGELSTYSKKTLELHYEHLLNEKSRNMNASEITLESMVRKYGYKSLEEANEAMKNR
jgi:hypothetical protein